jgi:hypothetical protein
MLLIWAAKPGANMSQSQFDLEAFRNFERTSHDKFAESYYDAFLAVTNSAIEPLLKAAAKAAERGARVIATKQCSSSSAISAFEGKADIAI